MRKNQRENLQPITGILLAEGLGNYAFPGDEYIESIQITHKLQPVRETRLFKLDYFY